MQPALHVLPKALAAAGCSDNAIYASAAALTNATNAQPAVKHLSRMSANVRSNRLNRLSAYLVLHVRWNARLKVHILQQRQFRYV